MNLGKIVAWGMLIIIVLSGVGSFSWVNGERINVKASTITIILIHNVYELQNMTENLSGHYALANDINATITKNWNGGAGFVPIGNLSEPFNGTFDGGGYSITGLFINSSAGHVGLFGYTSINATIENVLLLDVRVSGRLDAGGLVGENEGIVSHIYVSGKVNGFAAGGLIGDNDGTVISGYATGNMYGIAVGGLIGWNRGTVSNGHFIGNVNGSTAGELVGLNDGTVSNSYATGSVSSSKMLADLGGLVGCNYGIISNSYAKGSVSASGRWTNAGGLIGENNGRVEECYATGKVSMAGDNSLSGGLVGNNQGTVKNSYATGTVNGSTAGGLAGWNMGTVKYSFWDVNTSGIRTSDGGNGKTTVEMMNESTFLSGGWDFNHTWGIWNGHTYPILKWTMVPRDLCGDAGIGYVNLTWEKPVNDVDGSHSEYRIYRNGTLIATVPAVQLWYNDTNVSGVFTYTYYVTSVNGAGESERSNVVNVAVSSESHKVKRAHNPKLIPLWVIALLAILIVTGAEAIRKIKSKTPRMK